MPWIRFGSEEERREEGDFAKRSPGVRQGRHLFKRRESESNPAPWIAIPELRYRGPYI
jgi:hypothetical protein